MPPTVRRLAGEALFLAAALAAALDVERLRRARSFVWSAVTPALLAAGEAPTPFQYRALTAWAARGAARAGVALDTAFHALDVAAVLGLAYASRAQLAALFEDARTPRARARLAGALLAPLTVMALPWQHMLNGWHHPTGRVIWLPWDLPAVALFTACVWLLRAARWRFFYPLFVLATLNKETTLALAPMYAWARWGERPRREVLTHTAAMLVAWAAVTAALRAAYAANPGAGRFEDHLDDNLQLLARPWDALFVLGVFAFAWVPAAAMAPTIPDRFTRRALAVVPAWAAAMLVAGNLYELRVFGELSAVVLPAWVLAARAALDGAPPDGGDEPARSDA